MGLGGRDFSIMAYSAEAPHFIADTVGILSSCPHQGEFVISRVYFSQTSVIYF